MAFSFASQPGLGQVYLPQLSNPGWNPNPPVQFLQQSGDPPAAPAQPSPQQPQQQAAQGSNDGQPDMPPQLRVSPWEVALSMLSNGGTPGEAAQAVRQVKLKNLQDAYAVAQQQMLMQALQNAPPTRRLAMLLNPAKEGEALSSSDQDMVLSQGQTRNGPNGSFFAPQTGVTDAGQPYAFTQEGFRTLGPQLPGKKTATDGIVFDNNSGSILNRYATPQKVGPGETLYPFMPGFGNGPGASSPQADAPASAPAAGASGAGALSLLNSNGQLDPHAFFTRFWLPQEGGLNPADGNGAPTNMGINQTANPQVNVKTLTPQSAEQLFTAKYFGPSGAGNLPPALGLVHADTYGINPKMAQTFLAQSGGDPMKYLQLREGWMGNLVKTNPNLAKYAGPWSNRNAALESLVGQLAPQQGGGPQGGNVPTEIGPGVQGRTYQTFGPGDPRGANLPPGASGQIAPDGQVTPIQGTYIAPEQVATIKGDLLSKAPITDYLTAHDAYGAMIRAAAQPNGGMRAYSLRDTFARTINPGAVARVGTIEAIKDSQGVPANIKAYFMNLKGDGNVPPEIAQQILDISRGFLASHYGTAKSINDSYAQFAKNHHLDPSEITVPMDGEPLRMILGAVPPPAQRQTGAVYSTPKGPLLYLGNGQWRKF